MSWKRWTGIFKGDAWPKGESMGLGLEFCEDGVFEAFTSTRSVLAICEEGVYGEFTPREFEFVFCKGGTLVEFTSTAFGFALCKRGVFGEFRSMGFCLRVAKGGFVRRIHIEICQRTDDGSALDLVRSAFLQP